MTKRSYYIIWAGLFILCAALGFIPEPTGAVRVLLTLVSLVFFLPPAVLLYYAAKQRDSLTIRLIFSLSAGSLVLTVAAIVANFLSLMAPEAVGNVLYAMLVIVSSPMVCSGYWVLSLFLWACLLMASGRLQKRK